MGVLKGSKGAKKRRKSLEEALKCDRCNYATTLAGEMTEHKKLPHDLICGICKERADTRHNLIGHCVSKHDKNEARKALNACQLCKAIPITKEELRTHMSTAHGGDEDKGQGQEEDRTKKVKCEKCDFLADDENTLKIHTAVKHGPPDNSNDDNNRDSAVKKCSKCGFETQNESEYEEHKNRPHLFNCADCDLIYIDSAGLKGHRREGHGEDFGAEQQQQQQQQQQQPHKCRDCDFETSSEEDIIRHSNYPHTKECNLCSFKSVNDRRLKGHLAKAHPENQGQRSSPQKNKKSSFECRECDFATGIQKNLEIHSKLKHVTVKSDPDEILKRCEFCDYVSGIERNMRIHKKVKHKEEYLTEKCDFCDFKAPSNGEMLLHSKSKHSVCDVCDFAAANEDDLAKHKTDTHEFNHSISGQSVSSFMSDPFEDLQQETTTTVISNSDDDDDDDEVDAGRGKQEVPEGEGSAAKKGPFGCFFCDFSTEKQEDIDEHEKTCKNEA